MARVKRGVVKHARKKEVVDNAKGYYGRAGTCYRVAIEKVEKGMQYAYRDRKRRKRDFRKLWIQRINAAVREHGMVYSRFVDGMNKAGITLDRKILSDLAITQPEAFKNIVDQAQKALEGKVNVKKAA